MKVKILLLTLLLALPLVGIAVQENAVIPLPTVAPELPVRRQSGSEYSVENMAGYFGLEETGGYPYQTPSLTETEKRRAVDLLREYDAGVRPRGTILGVTENVRVGVYALNPEDYEGQAVYVLLPMREMSDDEILMIIDAYAQLSLRFDPDTLSFRNCARGGSIETSRFLTDEERERMSVLRKLFRRQGLRPDREFTPLPGDDGLGWVQLHEEDFAGLPDFRFRPYRYQSDEELLRFISFQDTGEDVAPTEYAEYERQTRAELLRLMNAPLSLNLTQEEMGYADENSVHMDHVRVYRAYFETATKGGHYFSLLDVETGRVVFAWPGESAEGKLKYSDLHLDPYDARWLAAVRRFIAENRLDGVGIRSIEPMGEISIQDIGFGALFGVFMEDGGYYELTVPYQTEEVYGGLMYMIHPPKPVTREELNLGGNE